MTTFRKTLWFILIGILIVLCLAVYAAWPFLLKMVYPIKYQQYVDAYSKQFNVDRFLVYSVIKAESQFNPIAQSGKGAKGLMQITNSTGGWAFYTLDKQGFEPELLFDPETNVMVGTWYLSWLMNEFNDNLELVICAYNCGHGRVKQWLMDESVSESGKSLDRIPFSETRDFMNRVLKYYKVYNSIYAQK